MSPRDPTLERRRSLRFGWTLLLVGATGGVTLELAHAFKLSAYLDDALTRLLLTLAHAHAMGLALVVLAHAVAGADRVGARTGHMLRVGSALVPLGFALGAVGHPESDPSLGILLTPVGAALVLFALASLTWTAWRPPPP